MSEKNLTYYLSLPYRVEVYPDEEGKGFTASVPDLPGCLTSADSLADLWPMVEDAKQVWLNAALEANIPIPEPKKVEVEEFSGKFVIRVPKTLHRQLSIRAEEEGTSLNQFVLTLLGQAMGLWYGKRYQEQSERVYDIYRELISHYYWSIGKHGLSFQQERLETGRQPVMEWKPEGINVIEIKPLSEQVYA